MGKKSLVQLLGLTGLFLVFFLLPIAVSKLFTVNNLVERPTEIEEAYFPGAPYLGDKREYLEVASDRQLEPSSQGDFLLLTWVSFRELPKTGGKQIFVAKYNSNNINRSGYAMGLTRERDLLRPVVYWVDPEGRGAWYSFNETVIFPGKWYLFALSYYAGQTLSLQIVSINGVGIGEQAPSIQSLGGHLLEPGQIPSNKSSLQVGSFHEARFEGRIGPIGVLRFSQLSQNLLPFLKEYTTKEGCLGFNEQLAQKYQAEISFYTNDWKTDLSRNRLNVRLYDERRNKK